MGGKVALVFAGVPVIGYAHDVLLLRAHALCAQFEYDVDGRTDCGGWFLSLPYERRANSVGA